MSPQTRLEERLSQLERDVARLKSKVNGDGRASDDWVDDVSGKFEGDDAFREILELGKQVRESQIDDSEA